MDSRDPYQVLDDWEVVFRECRDSKKHAAVAEALNPGRPVPPPHAHLRRRPDFRVPLKIDHPVKWMDPVTCQPIYHPEWNPRKAAPDLPQGH